MADLLTLYFLMPGSVVLFIWMLVADSKKSKNARTQICKIIEQRFNLLDGDGERLYNELRGACNKCKDAEWYELCVIYGKKHQILFEIIFLIDKYHIKYKNCWLYCEYRKKEIKFSSYNELEKFIASKFYDEDEDKS